MNTEASVMCWLLSDSRTHLLAVRSNGRRDKQAFFGFLPKGPDPFRIPQVQPNPDLISHRLYVPKHHFGC